MPLQDIGRDEFYAILERIQQASEDAMNAAFSMALISAVWTRDAIDHVDASSIRFFERAFDKLVLPLYDLVDEILNENDLTDEEVEVFAKVRADSINTNRHYFLARASNFISHSQANAWLKKRRRTSEFN